MQTRQLGNSDLHITPLGIGSAATWDGLVSGRSGVRQIQSWDPSDLEVKIAGEVAKKFDLPWEFIATENPL